MFGFHAAAWVAHLFRGGGYDLVRRIVFPKAKAMGHPPDATRRIKVAGSLLPLPEVAVNCSTNAGES